MADKDKKPQELSEEIKTFEIPGNQNPWKKKDTRFTESILNEASSRNFTNQTLSSIIRRDQNIQEDYNSRISMVIDEKPASDYEKMLYRVASPANKDTAAGNDLKKIYTRNAESKNYFLKPWWEYDDSNLGLYKRFLSTELHTVSLETVSGENTVSQGQIVDVLYDDASQDTANILSKTGKQSYAIYGLNSPSKVFDVQKGEDTSTSTLPKIDPPDGSLAKEVSEFWSPDVNPCAAPAGREKDLPVWSFFGPRIRPNKGYKQWHAGIDTGIREGFPIVAISLGRITKISPSSGQPKTLKNAIVTIEHDVPEDKKTYTIKTRSMHLCRIAEKDGKRLEVGDIVRAGEPIGYMGGEELRPGSGNTTGPHLHFELHLTKKDSDGNTVYDIFKIDDVKEPPKGATNPLYFDYPKFQTFNADEATLKKLKDLIPPLLPQKKDDE